MQFSAGQRWCYRAPAGFEASRIVIGAAVIFPDEPPVLCCSVTGAPRRRPDGTVDAVTIPFLPMTDGALRASVTFLDGADAPPAAKFLDALENWQADPLGLTTFTVPFEGFLDRMIAMQMAEIVGVNAA